jgi:hypothetical protein
MQSEIMGRGENAARGPFHVCSRPQTERAGRQCRTSNSLAGGMTIRLPAAWLSFESNSLNAALQRDKRRQNR